jgi:nitrate reductase gamma subunit
MKLLKNRLILRGITFKNKIMKYIKIIFLTIVFYCFAPINSYAIIQKVYEKPQLEAPQMEKQERKTLFAACFLFALGIYPFVKGLTKILATPTSIVDSFMYVMLFLIGAIIILVSLVGFVDFFIRRYRRTHAIKKI